jgi:membrane protease YdiL (CAAX protease family)
MFTVFRLGSRSIWSAVVCHSAFNVTMVGVIVFYYP